MLYSFVSYVHCLVNHSSVIVDARVFSSGTKCLVDEPLRLYYTAILEKNENAVWWAPKKNDLTDRVVADFNKAK